MRLSTALAACALLAACDNPLDEVERLSEVELAGDGAAAVMAPADETGTAPGFLARVFGGTNPGAGVTLEEPAAASPADPEAQATAAAAPARAGFLGVFGRPAAAPPAAAPPADGPDAAVIAPGTTLPYGAIATVCGLSSADLGEEVNTASGVTLHDSAPGGTAQRTHYLTGFPDGCARQFTAALAIFGDVGTHEVVRYLPANADQAWSATDEAYEEIKGRICRVPRGQPCGAALDRLERNTTFVTVYGEFGTNPVWAEILVHDGAVVAMTFESN